MNNQSEERRAAMREELERERASVANRIARKEPDRAEELAARFAILDGEIDSLTGAPHLGTDRLKRQTGRKRKAD